MRVNTERNERTKDEKLISIWGESNLFQLIWSMNRNSNSFLRFILRGLPEKQFSNQMFIISTYIERNVIVWHLRRKLKFFIQHINGLTMTFFGLTQTSANRAHNEGKGRQLFSEYGFPLESMVVPGLWRRNICLLCTGLNRDICQAFPWLYSKHIDSIIFSA